MTIVAYSLVDLPDTERDFNNVKDAVDWMKNISRDMFNSVSLTDGKGNIVNGFDAIIDAYDQNRDLLAGDADCIHLKIHDGIGGGCHCNTCTAWFCY